MPMDEDKMRYALKRSIAILVCLSNPVQDQNSKIMQEILCQSKNLSLICEYAFSESGHDSSIKNSLATLNFILDNHWHLKEFH